MSYPSLSGELDVAVGEDAVEFSFAVTNAGPDPVELRFASGLDVDFAVRRGDETVWRWSDGRLFTQAVRDVTLAPGEAMSRTAAWEDPRPGRYEAVATLEAVHHALQTAGPFEV